MGDLDASGKGFELTEGGAGFGEVAVVEVDAGEDAAEGVGGSVPAWMRMPERRGTSQR